MVSVLRYAFFVVSFGDNSITCDCCAGMFALAFVLSRVCHNVCALFVLMREPELLLD